MIAPTRIEWWLDGVGRVVLDERDDIGHILGVQAVPVDGDTIRAGALYVLRGGKVVEVES